MLREQNLIEILSRADTSGVDATTSALDREKAALDRLYSSARGDAFASVERSSRNAAVAFDETGSAASALGGNLDQLSAKDVDIRVDASTDQATAALAAVDRSAEEAGEDREVAVTAETNSAEEQLRRVRIAGHELTEPHTMLVTASTEGAAAALGGIRTSLLELDNRALVVTADTTSAAGALANTKQAVDELTSAPKTVTVTADVTSAQQSLGGIQQTLQSIGTGGGAQTFQMLAGGMRAIATGGGPAAAAIQGLSSSTVPLIAGLGAGAVALGAIGTAAIGGAGQMETYAVQFEVLLGSADAAQERIAELVDFAAKTPFEIPEVVRASKVLQTFGGEALATGDSLRIVGDVAAGTNRPFDEMALLLGRIKVGLESGLVPGDQLIQLQAMGALTVDGRKKIMEYAEAIRTGAASSEGAWDAVTSQLGTFSGMMERQSGTFEGKLSNMQDALGTTARELGEIFLPAAKFVLDQIITILTGVQSVIAAVGDAIEWVTDRVGDAVGAINDFAMNFGAQRTEIDAMAEDVGVTFDEMKERISTRMRESGEDFTTAATVIKGEMEGARLKVSTDAWQMMQDINAAAVQGRPPFEENMRGIAAVPANEIRARHQEVRDAAYQSMVEYAKGLMDAQDEPKVQMDALAQMQEEVLTTSAEVARLLGQLHSQELADGLADARPAVNAQAQATRQAIENRLKELNAWQAGYNTGTSYGDGLGAAYGYVITKAGTLAAATAGQIGIQSEPKDPTSPLRGITRWGGNVAHEFAKMGDYEGEVRSAAMRLAGAANPLWDVPVAADYDVARMFAMPGQVNAMMAAPVPGYLPPGVDRLGAPVPGVSIGSINIQLPEGWTGTRDEVSDLSERLAQEIRLSQLSPIGTALVS